MAGFQRASTALVLIVGIVATGLAGWFAYRHYQRVEIERAAHKTENATSAVRLALDRVALSVSAVRAMYAADWVTPDQFERFARTLSASESTRSLAFYRRVPLADRLSQERMLSGEPAATLGIWEFGEDGEPMRAGDRMEYFVIESGYLTNGATPLIGLDAASLPGRREYIERAISTFGLVVSDVLVLSNTEEAGLLFYLPAIDSGGSVVGVATGSVTLKQLAGVAALASGAFGISITVDGNAGAGAADDLAGETAEEEADPYSRTFAFGGRSWTVTVPTATGGTIASAWVVVLIVGAGLATTVAIAAYMVGLARTAEVREARARLRSMLDGLGPLAWLLSPDGTIVYANRTAIEALERPESHMEGMALWELLPHGSEHGDPTLIRNAVKNAAAGHDVRFDLFIDREGDAEQVFDLWIRPLSDKKGLTSDLVASAVDVTSRHEVEQTQRLLMRELDHRMKNTLQVVQAIIRRTARAQATVAKFESVLIGRVGAMSRAHELLAQERWLGAGMATIVGQEVRSFDAGDAIKAIGPNIRLNPKAALSIAMAIHELGTNASKYGALSTSNGRIDVAWSTDRKDGESWLEVKWVEAGGPEVTVPKDNGFGTMLIERSIAYELDGHATIDYRKTGLECTIALPMRSVSSVAGRRTDRQKQTATV